MSVPSSSSSDDVSNNSISNNMNMNINKKDVCRAVMLYFKVNQFNMGSNEDEQKEHRQGC